MTCHGPSDPFDDGDDRAYNLERVAATKLLIVKYEQAIDALSTGAQSYQLDTGQTRQLVSKAQLGSLQLTLTRLEARLATLQMRSGKARFYVRPGW
jgi:hypothetical protein